MSMHPGRNLFAEFLNPVFVETGSYRGDAIQLAIDAGFQKIISIEADPVQVEFCRNRFDLFNNPTERIQIIQGDSAYCLGFEIRNITDRITFWLDAHWQMLEGTEPGANPFPVLLELQQIGMHPHRNDHTIIIDDMLLMQPDIVGYDNNAVRRALLEINPAYKLEYFSNPVINNILVAHV